MTDCGCNRSAAASVTAALALLYSLIGVTGTGVLPVLGTRLALAERRIAALREAAAPLLAVRRFHRRRELAWVEALTGLLPQLRTLAQRPDDRAALTQVMHTLTAVADDVRAAAR